MIYYFNAIRTDNMYAVAKCMQFHGLLFVRMLPIISVLFEYISLIVYFNTLRNNIYGNSADC